MSFFPCVLLHVSPAHRSISSEEANARSNSSSPSPAFSERLLTLGVVEVNS